MWFDYKLNWAERHIQDCVQYDTWEEWQQKQMYEKLLKDCMGFTKVQ